MTQPTEDDEDRSSEEQAILNEIAEARGKEFAEEHAELILAQARLLGEL